MRPYGVKKGGKIATKAPDCCPGHSSWEVQFKYAKGCRQHKKGRRSLKKRERRLAKEVEVFDERA